jgi:hypothetical protein
MNRPSVSILIPTSLGLPCGAKAMLQQKGSCWVGGQLRRQPVLTDPLAGFDARTVKQEFAQLGRLVPH